jgi:hypothetical protein
VCFELMQSFECIVVVHTDQHVILDGEQQWFLGSIIYHTYGCGDGPVFSDDEFTRSNGYVAYFEGFNELLEGDKNESNSCDNGKRDMTYLGIMIINMRVPVVKCY